MVVYLEFYNLFEIALLGWVVFFLFGVPIFRQAGVWRLQFFGAKQQNQKRAAMLGI